MFKKLIITLAIFLPCSVQAAASAQPQAKVFDLSGKLLSDFVFFDPEYTGAADIAIGDINGDGIKEISICPGAGHEAIVKSYSAYGVDKGEISAYGKNFSGGCYLSSADITGDGQDEIITGAGFGGGPQVKIFEIGKERRNFFAFAKSLRRGVRVASADLGGDGKAEIVAFANLNAPAEYAVFGNDGHQITNLKIRELNGNGLSLAIGDYNGDGKKEFAVAGGFGNSSVIYVFAIDNTLLKTINYSKSDYKGGLNLAAGDINGDKKDEIIVTESFEGGGEVSVYNFDGVKVRSFIAYPGAYYSGIKIGVGDVNGDGQSEIVTIPERVGADPIKSDYKFITVDLSKQTLYRYQNGGLLDKFLISSGKARTPTPTGEFAIYNKRPKVRMSWYFGPDNPLNYDLPNVPWVASFSGPYTIHGTYWHHNFGHPMSHGCVNMYTPDAKIVYDWADIGTPVVIN